MENAWSPLGSESVADQKLDGKIRAVLFTLLDLCVSSLRGGHAKLLCIVPILTDDPRRASRNKESFAKFSDGPPRLIRRGVGGTRSAAPPLYYITLYHIVCYHYYCNYT